MTIQKKRLRAHKLKFKPLFQFDLQKKEKKTCLQIQIENTTFLRVSPKLKKVPEYFFPLKKVMAGMPYLDTIFQR